MARATRSTTRKSVLKETRVFREEKSGVHVPAFSQVVEVDAAAKLSPPQVTETRLSNPEKLSELASRVR